MGTKKNAPEDDASAALLGFSPKTVVLTVASLATIMVLWPLGGLQMLREVLFDSHYKTDFMTQAPTSSAAQTLAATSGVAGQAGERAAAEEQERRPTQAPAEVEAAQLRAELTALRARQKLDGLPQPTLDAGETLAHRRPERPRIGASVALHPPKFSFVARFLEQWYLCEPARRSMDMYVVFWGDKDASLFKKGMAKLHPQVPADSWKAVVSEVPEFASRPGGVSNQIIAAWKKWYGITYMMDLGENAPDYGLMLDSELLVYNTSDCGPNSAWYRLFERVQALETSKLWKAAQVNDAAMYDFGSFKQSGKDYDRFIIEDNARFVLAHPDQPQCAWLPTPGCREVKRQIDSVLFSWWTDVPYMNLEVAKRMLLALDKQEVKSVPNADQLGKWCTLAHYILFPRFEHISYQQWCLMHEGYHWDDVTAVTDNAVWGSYLEDPKPTKGYGSSRLAELHPLWLPADANMAIKDGKVPPMSHIDPPLMHLHVDHFSHEYDCWPAATKWNEFFKEEGTEWKWP